MTKLIVFPGGFHPFHVGHKAVYDLLQKKFPKAMLLVAATDSQETRPFSFDEKKILADAAGVSNFVEVEQPFNMDEYTKRVDEPVVLIFAISTKEFNEDGGRFDFTKDQIKSRSPRAEYKNGSTTIKIYPKIEANLKTT